jgi:hypothetical protein
VSEWRHEENAEHTGARRGVWGRLDAHAEPFRV